MIKGVSAEHFRMIQDLLHPYFNAHRFFMYGSRINGNFQKNSDLDILVRSKANEKIDLTDLGKIRCEFDESNLPFLVHFTDFYEMDPVFYNSLKDTLVEVC